MEKRNKKRAARVENPEPDVAPVFGEPVLKNGCGQNQKDAVTWFHVHEWFREGITRNNREWLFEAKAPYRDRRGDQHSSSGVLGWCDPEKACAKRLLAQYGAEMVEKAVNWMCDNWQALKDSSGGRLMGAPSVRLLWSSRERFMAEVQAGTKVEFKKPQKKRHMVGEYDPDLARGIPDVGW